MNARIVKRTIGIILVIILGIAFFFTPYYAQTGSILKTLIMGVITIILVAVAIGVGFLIGWLFDD